MCGRSHGLLPLVLAALLAGTLVAPGAGAKAAPVTGSLSQVALELVAKEYALPLDALAVLASAVASYPLTGATASEFKVVDRRTGTLYPAALDATGKPVDLGLLEAVEQKAYAAKYGTLDPALAEKLASQQVEAVLPVTVWLSEPEYVGATRPDPAGSGPATQAQADAYFAEVDARRAAAVEAVVGPVATRLAALGYPLASTAYAPALFGLLPPEAIQTVAAWDEVQRIYLAPNLKPLLEVARPTIKADVVHGRAITGSGVKLAQIEVGGRVATSNPYLSGVTQDGTYVCTAPSLHSTGIAGIVRSTHTTTKGIAYGANLWAGGSCMGVEAEMTNRSTAAITWGARALNLSFGRDSALVPDSLCRFYDGMVINNYRTIIPAAANAATACGSGNGGNVWSPGLAYNVVTVGSFDDKNTTSWSDDAMSPTSSWRDPISTHNDREKPEVAAPGANINSTTTASPWVGSVGSGTSYAAPMVTGVAGLIMQRNTSLQTWPEAVKAILMVTAVHNIEGSARMSECDGAGGIAADRADDVARKLSGASWGAQSYTCSTATPLDVASMALTGGTRTRAAIVWDTDPNYASYASQPGADLDLQIVNSAGTVVASSAYYDNTYEIVDWTPAATGTYKLRVVRYRCSYNPKWLGWAWRKGN